MKNQKLQSKIILATFLLAILFFSLNTTPTLAGDHFTITVVQGPNGRISPNVANVNLGGNQTFTINPDTDYSIAYLIVDSSTVEAASTYTFYNVTANHMISASFSPNPTPTPTPTATPTPTPTPSPTPNPTPTPTPTATPTPTPTPNPTPTDTPTSTSASTPTPNSLPTSTAEPSSTSLFVALHDIAISQISPSNNPVQMGQMFGFEVVVKNKGASNETFSVTLYCNDTKIGEQRIVAMSPTSEKTLSFQCDLSGFTKENVYSIKATTSEIKNDLDPENNICTLSYVKQTENSGIPPATGVFGGTNWIYFALGLAGFGTTCLLVFKKLKPKHPGNESLNSNPNRFQGISDIINGTFPDAYSIMIVGKADSEKSVCCQQLANGYLEQGKPVLFITYEQFPEEVRRNMKELGWDITGDEEKGNFVFLDAYSRIGGKESVEKYSIKQPFVLSELGIGISLALSSFERNSVKVFLDSTSPLFTRMEPSKIAEFLQDRIAKVKGENAMFIFTIGKGTIQENLQRRLEEMVDCVIELEVQKGKKKTIRKVHFKKLRGQNQPNFDIVELPNR